MASDGEGSGPTGGDPGAGPVAAPRRPRSPWGSVPLLLLLAALVIGAATVGLTEGSGAPEPDRRLLPPATGADRRPSVLWSVPVDCGAHTVEVDGVEQGLGCRAVVDDQRAFLTEARPAEAPDEGPGWGVVARDLATGTPAWFRTGEVPPLPRARAGAHLVVDGPDGVALVDPASGEDRRRGGQPWVERGRYVAVVGDVVVVEQGPDGGDGPGATLAPLDGGPVRRVDLPAGRASLHPCPGAGAVVLSSPPTLAAGPAGPGRPWWTVDEAPGHHLPLHDVGCDADLVASVRDEVLHVRAMADGAELGSAPTGGEARVAAVAGGTVVTASGSRVAGHRAGPDGLATEWSQPRRPADGADGDDGIVVVADGDGLVVADPSGRAARYDDRGRVQARRELRGGGAVVTGDLLVTWDAGGLTGIGLDDLLPRWAVPVDGVTDVVPSPDGDVLVVVTPSSIVAFG